MPLNRILRKSAAGYKLSRSQENINHLMYMEKTKLFAKSEKELETLLNAVRIYSLDIGMEFGIEKCAMLVMNRSKRQFRLGYLRVSQQQFCLLCNLRMTLDLASSLSRKLAYVPGPTFGYVKLLASSGLHCTKWTDEQHINNRVRVSACSWPPLPFITTLIGLRAFDLVSSIVWWETLANIDIWLTEWNYKITTKLERSKKTKPTNTRGSWRLTPSNKCKWKTRSKNISGERENYSRQNSPAETSSKK